MKNNFFRFCIFLFLLLNYSCSSEKDKKKEVINWVESFTNGLHTIAEVEGIRYDLQYLPPVYRAIIAHPNSELEYIDSVAMADSVLEFYTLKLFPSNSADKVSNILAGNQREKDQLGYYFSFNMQDDIILMQGDSTYKPALYHYEKSYGIRNEETFVMAFETGKGKKGIARLVIDSKVLSEGAIELGVKAEKVSLKNI